MTLYKSLVFKDASDALPTILRCLEADKKKAKKDPAVYFHFVPCRSLELS